MSREEINYFEYIEKLNSLPIFTKIAKEFNYQRIGLQILKNNSVIREFTSYNKNGRIIKLEEGLKNVDMTAKIEEKTLKQMISNQAWIEENPLEAAIKYSSKIKVPFVVKLKFLKLLTKM